MNEPPSDSEPAADDLVRRAKRDRTALGELYDRYYGPVFRYCRRRLCDRTAAEDVTSEVFLSVARHMRGFEGTCDTDFRCWLFRIATNAVNAQLRQSLRRQAIWQAAAESGALAADSEIAAPTDEAIDALLVHRLLLELEPRQQSIVSLRFFAGLSHDEIAGVLESTSGAIRTALSRTLAQLRERLNEHEARQNDARRNEE